MAKKSYGTLNQFKATVQNRINELEGRPVEVESAQSITAASNLPRELKYIYDDLKYTLGAQHVSLAVTADLGDGQTAVISLNAPVDNQVLLAKIDFSDEVFEAPEKAVNYVIDEWNKEPEVKDVESAEDADFEEVEEIDEDAEPITASTISNLPKDEPFDFGCVTC